METKVEGNKREKNEKIKENIKRNRKNNRLKG